MEEIIKKVRIILNELLEKSLTLKKANLTVDEYEIDLSELSFYEFFVFQFLQDVESTHLDRKRKKDLTKEFNSKEKLINLTFNDKIIFKPKLISIYLKEIENE